MPQTKAAVAVQVLALYGITDAKSIKMAEEDAKKPREMSRYQTLLRRQREAEEHDKLRRDMAELDHADLTMHQLEAAKVRGGRRDDGRLASLIGELKECLKKRQSRIKNKRVNFALAQDRRAMRKNRLRQRRHMIGIDNDAGEGDGLSTGEGGGTGASSGQFSSTVIEKDAAKKYRKVRKKASNVIKSLLKANRTHNFEDTEFPDNERMSNPFKPSWPSQTKDDADARMLVFNDPDNISPATQYLENYNYGLERQTNATLKNAQDRGGFSARDVRQGAVSDCWILATLAALADREEGQMLLDDIFLDYDEQKGVYALRIFLEGRRPDFIIIDDRFIRDTDEGKFAFCSNEGRAIWPMLIEKALAKAFGSFESLSYGDVIDAMEMLTGLFCRTIQFRSGRGNQVQENPKLKSGVLFEELMRHNDAGLIMTAGSAQAPEGSNGKSDDHNNQGIANGHAYSLQDVRFIPKGKVSNCEERLVQLRNPWGGAYHEGHQIEGYASWEGRFSDRWFKGGVKYSQDSKDEMSKEPLKQILGWKDNSQGHDDTFWMSWEDFTSHSFFDTVTLCHYFPSTSWHRERYRGSWENLNCFPQQTPMPRKKGKAADDFYKELKERMLKNSPLFTIEVSHAGTLYVELMCDLGEGSSNAPGGTKPSVALQVYDWDNMSAYDQDKSDLINTIGVPTPTGPMVAQAVDQPFPGLSKSRSLQLEVCGGRHPVANRTYYVVAPRFMPKQEDDLDFTINVWYKPKAPVQLENSLLTLNARRG